MRIYAQDNCPSFSSLCVQRNDVSKKQNKIMAGIIYKLAERRGPKQKTHIDRIDSKGFDIYLTKGGSEDSVAVMMRRKEGDQKPIYCGRYFSAGEFKANKLQKKANSICKKDNLIKFLAGTTIVSITVSVVTYISKAGNKLGKLILRNPKV